MFIKPELSKNLTTALDVCIKAIKPYCHRTVEQKLQAEEKASKNGSATGGPEELLEELATIRDRKDLYGNDIEYERICGLITMCMHFLKRSSAEEHRAEHMNNARRSMHGLLSHLLTSLDLTHEDRFPGYDIGRNYFNRLGIRLLSSVDIIVNNIKEHGVRPDNADIADNIAEMEPPPGGFVSKHRPAGQQLWLTPAFRNMGIRKTSR